MTKQETKPDVEVSKKAETIEKKPVDKVKKEVEKQVSTPVEVEEKPRRKAGRPKKEKKYNEQGQLLTKSGKVDKRVELLKLNRQKSAVYQALKQAKKVKQKALDEDEEILKSKVEDSDTDDDAEEYEYEEVELKKKEPVIQVKEVKVIDEKLLEEVENTKKENLKLKQSFKVNSHLERIGMMSNRIKIKI